jgi:hypothetical protein
VPANFIVGFPGETEETARRISPSIHDRVDRKHSAMNSGQAALRAECRTESLLYRTASRSTR